MKQFWLLKSEPTEYSWDDMVKDAETLWDGVKNYQALRNMSLMQTDDLAFFYHTGKFRAAVGVVKIITKSHLIYVSHQYALPNPVKLSSITQNNIFRNHSIARQPRLSVIQLSALEWATIIAMS